MAVPSTPTAPWNLALAALVIAGFLALSGCLGSNDDAEVEPDPEDEAPNGANAEPAAPEASRDPINIHIEMPTPDEDLAETEAPVPEEKDSKGLLSCKTERNGLLKLNVDLGSVGVDVCV